MRAPVDDLHVSNLLTYASLGAAVLAVGAALDGRRLSLAGAAIAFSVLTDTFDGRFAGRFLRSARQARFGAELDSLVDAVVFGLTPVVVLAADAGRTPGSLSLGWWAAATVYVLGAVTRLGFYNVEGDDGRFVGIPTPAAALLCSTALVAPAPTWAVSWLLLLAGTAMVCPLEITRPRKLCLAAFALWAVVLVIWHGLKAA